MKAVKKATKKAKPKQSTFVLQLGDQEFSVTAALSKEMLDILERIGHFAHEQCAVAFQNGAHTVEHSIERAVTKMASVPPPPPEQA